MKTLLYLLAIPTLLISCANPKEVERLKNQNDSLNQIINSKVSEVDNLLFDLDEISSNLGEIKQRQGMINKSASGDVATDAKTRIQEDLMVIQQLMDENKTKLAELQKKMKNSNTKMAGMEKMIANLQKAIEEKDVEIAILQGELEKMNIQVAAYRRSTDSLSTENQARQEVIDKQTADLNTAYYAIGSFKELKDAKVVTPGGAFNTKKDAKLSPEFNESYFTRVDIRNIREISINSKKARLATAHPAGSYKFQEAGKMVEKLIINDHKKFWQSSKYCVVVLE
jgi:hypothetical protein